MNTTRTSVIRIDRYRPQYPNEASTDVQVPRPRRLHEGGEAKRRALPYRNPLDEQPRRDRCPTTAHASETLGTRRRLSAAGENTTYHSRRTSTSFLHRFAPYCSIPSLRKWMTLRGATSWSTSYTST